MTTTITSDFDRDLAAIVTNRLAAVGYPGQTFGGARDALITYCELQRRLIPAAPRRVLKPIGFSCPTDQIAGLQALEAKITKGDDLRPHLHRALKDLLSQDQMLNEWGIHHFHLGTTLESDGFVTRTGPLLYARVTVEAVFFIWVRNHGEWENEDLLQVLHDNWPDSLAAFKSPGIALEMPQASAAERKEFRKVGINSFVQVTDGSIYCPPGIGMTLAGHKPGSGKKKGRPRSVAAVRRAMVVLNAVKQMKRRLEEVVFPNLASPAPPKLAVRLVELDIEGLARFDLEVDGETMTVNVVPPGAKPGSPR